MKKCRPTGRRTCLADHQAAAPDAEEGPVKCHSGAASVSDGGNGSHDFMRSKGAAQGFDPFQLRRAGASPAGRAIPAEPTCFPDRSKN